MSQDKGGRSESGIAASGKHKAVLEGNLKLKTNVKKSKVVSVYSIRKLLFLGFALGMGKYGVYIRAHAISLKKAKAKLKELTSRSQSGDVRKVMEKENSTSAYGCATSEVRA